MKMIRAIKIDTARQVIEEIEIPADNTLRAIQSAVDGYIERGIVEGMTDDLFINEEGLFDNSLNMFCINGAYQPFAGNGIIVGHTRSGRTVAATVPLEWVQKNVCFVSRMEIGRAFAQRIKEENLVEHFLKAKGKL